MAYELVRENFEEFSMLLLLFVTVLYCVKNIIVNKKSVTITQFVKTKIITRERKKKRAEQSANRKRKAKLCMRKIVKEYVVKLKGFFFFCFF